MIFTSEQKTKYIVLFQNVQDIRFETNDKLEKRDGDSVIPAKTL